MLQPKASLDCLSEDLPVKSDCSGENKVGYSQRVASWYSIHKLLSSETNLYYFDFAP